MTLEELQLSCRRIYIEDLRLLARLGIYPHEIAAAQEILISASVWVDKKPLGEDIENTVSYATLAEIARRIVRSHHFLVETVVEEMIREIRVLPGVRAGRVDCRIIEWVFVPVSGKYMTVGTYIIRLIPCIKCK